MLPILKEKYDYKKALKTLFTPSSKEPQVVTVPPMQFLVIEGKGGPNDNPEFEAAVSALYGCAFTIKFARKKAARTKMNTRPLPKCTNGRGRRVTNCTGCTKKSISATRAKPLRKN